jgi:molecular chaperone GrpE
MDLQITEKEQNLLPPADLTSEIERLKEELIRESNRNLRTLADFKNYRRRVERDGNKFAEDKIRGMLLPLLSVIDDMEKALNSSKDDRQNLSKGLRLIHEKIIKLLETNGVMPFESIGTPFDHNMHEAVAMMKLEGYEPGIVVDELRRGYLRNNELLRAAQVRVAE